MRIATNLTQQLTLIALCAAGASIASHARADALDLRSSDEPKTAPAAGDSLMLGAGLAWVPEYAGSDKSRVVVLPLLERTWDNGFFLSSRRGAGYQVTLGGVNLSAALSYGGARAEHKRNFGAGSDDLRGMGEIDGSAQAILGVSYTLGTVGLSASTTQNLSNREYGATYTFGASVPLYRSATDQVSLGMTAVYGDDKYAQTYFGVTAAQSAASGYKTYRAGGGFQTLGAAVNWNRVLDKNWSLHSSLGVTCLTGDAADSPLTRRKNTPVLMTGFSYKF